MPGIVLWALPATIVHAAFKATYPGGIITAIVATGPFEAVGPVPEADPVPAVGHAPAVIVGAVGTSDSLHTPEEAVANSGVVAAITASSRHGHSQDSIALFNRVSDWTKWNLRFIGGQARCRERHCRRYGGRSHSSVSGYGRSQML